MVPKSRNKFNARSVVGRDGERYDSLVEAEYGELLGLQQRAGDIRGYIVHPVVDMMIGVNHKWRLDFKVWNPYGDSWYVDVKGVETPRFRQNLRWWKQLEIAPLIVVKRVALMRFEITHAVGVDGINIP